MQDNLKNDFFLSFKTGGENFHLRNIKGLMNESLRENFHLSKGKILRNESSRKEVYVNV